MPKSYEKSVMSANYKVMISNASHVYSKSVEHFDHLFSLVKCAHLKLKIIESLQVEGAKRSPENTASFSKFLFSLKAVTNCEARQAFELKINKEKCCYLSSSMLYTSLK